jgi:hypothetical protein
MHALALSLLLLAAPATEYQWDDYKRADTKVVAYATVTPERAWAFIVSPDSPYAERRAVALNAGKVLDWSYLKRIDAAREEMTRSSERPPMSTFDERNKMPWQWQAALALDDVWRSVFEHGNRDTYFPFAAALPCRSAAEATFVRKVTTQMAVARRERMPVQIIGVWRNLLLRTKSASGNALGPYISPWTLRFNDPDSWRYAHVLILDRIEARDVYGAASYLHYLRERLNEVPGRDFPGPIGYSATLAIARHAISDQSMSGYGRVAAGMAVARALGGTFIPADSRLSPTIDEHQPELIRLFAEWFAPREKSVEAGAASETAALESARKTLAAVEQCRGGEAMPFY